MSDYQRTTRECSVRQLRPELFQAVQDYFREQRLGSLDTEILMCCETLSEKKGDNKLLSVLQGDVDTTIHMGMLLTSERLIWVRSGDQSGTRLNAADLKEIRVRAISPLFSKVHGLEIFGYVEGSKSRIRGFIGMGSESAAQKFCEAAQQAIDKVKPPSKKGKWWARLLGG
ncbi:MAG: hypothetical protein ACK2T5_08065 [Anaerolineales bacterium]